MKRKSLLLMLLCFAFLGVARAQVTIGDLETAGNDTYLPMNSLYEYSYTQQIYTADEIGTTGTINAITLWMYGAADLYEMPFDIYMLEVDNEAFASATDWIPVTASDIVYSGSVTVHNTTAEAYTFTLDVPFVYSGAGNLLIAFDNNTGQWKGGLNGKVFTATDNVNRSLYARQDSDDYDPTDMSGVTGTARAMRNVIEIDITPGGGPTCNKPRNVAVEYTGGTTATVTWVGDASQYNIDVNGTVTNNVTSPYTLTGLQLATTYTVKLQSNCGGGLLSDWTGGTVFSTDMCMPEDQCDLTFVLTDTYGDSWNGNAIKVTDVATGDVLATLANQNLDGTTGSETQTVTLAVCDGRALEFSWVAGSFPTETQYTVTDINNEVVLEGSGAFETFTFTPNCTPASCPKPQNLTVNYEGGTTATVTWTGDATAYNIDVNGTVTSGVTSPYTLSGLTLSTDYEVKVQGDCGSAGTSDWTSPVSFTTDACMPEDQIIVNYELTDSYGDGWNGNYILVVDESCTIVEMLTIESGASASGSLRVCGSYVQFLWYKGSYPTETSWVFTDNDGTVLFEGAGSSDMATLDVLYTIDNNPYSVPTDVAVSEVGPRSAKLSWTETGTATAWQIMLTVGDDEEGTIIDANSNPFVLTGLTPETEYFAQVRATGVNGTSIWTCLGAEWTTEVACPVPSNLSVTATPYAAEVTWDGIAEAYDLEWAMLPDDGSKDALWLQYDDGTYQGGIGNSTANTWTWGVMYPASMLAGNGLLSKVSIYETSTYNTADITINIYTGGDTAPETLVYTETVTPEAGDAFHEITFTEPIVIDPTQNLWITLTEYGTYVLSYCENGDNANNDWVSSGETWAHIGDLAASLAGSTWMIRGYVEPAYDPSTLEWNPVSGITPPYTMEGLRPETTYVVRVKANCGEEGESGWATITFITPSVCDMPIGLATEDITYNSATLNWTGYQESFNLRYRSAASDPNAPATIILEAHDTWEDGTGYQMLLDADATALGVEIPETGPYTGSDYSAFEYLIPENADCDSNTENLVFDGSVTLEIPAGVYDWCIINPEPGGNMWIVGTGDVPGRYDDYVFEPGVTYHFTMGRYGTGDGAGLEIIRDMGEWETVEGITAPYDLTDLRPLTYYEWQIQGVNESCGELAWSEIQSFITPEYTAPTEEDQDVSLAPGWNWWSSSLEMDATLDAALKDAIAAENTTAVIKNVGGNTMLENGTWSPDMVLDNESMYMIRVDNAVTATLTAAPADPTNHPITLASGWNWIGFPTVNAMTLDEAFAGITPNEEDVVKGTAGPATYTAEYGWNGSLTGLEPGVGYMYKNNGDPMTLVYPSTSKGMVRVVPMERYWMSDTHRHATTLTMLATLDASRYTMTEGNYEIGAFVGDECRGSARLQRVGSQYIAYLSVSGEEGETVRFKLYDVTNNVEQGLAEEQVSYVSNAITGTTHEPVVLHFRGTADVNESAYSVSMYPNPTKDEVMINGREIETVKVYNALGQLVYMEECGNADNVELHLNGLSAGVYTVNVRMANGQQANTMIVKQ
jgi:hypothetical protein